MSATFDVLAWEMELAGARCILLDSVIGELMGALPEDKRDRLMQGMHTVDLLSQQLTSLSAFARRMSGSVSEEYSVAVDDAIRDMTLGALADRMLAALGGDEKGVNERENAGDLDLF